MTPESWQFPPKYSGSDHFSSTLSSDFASSNTQSAAATTNNSNSSKMYPYVSVGSHGQQSPFGTSSSRSVIPLFISPSDIPCLKTIPGCWLTPLSSHISYFIGPGEYYLISASPVLCVVVTTMLQVYWQRMMLKCKDFFTKILPKGDLQSIFASLCSIWNFPPPFLPMLRSTLGLLGLVF